MEKKQEEKSPNINMESIISEVLNDKQDADKEKFTEWRIKLKKKNKFSECNRDLKRLQTEKEVTRYGRQNEKV